MKALIAILILLSAVPTHAGQFTSLITAAFPSAPKPPSPSGICENCGGTGKLGDGTVSVTCPVCNGTGRVVNAEASSAPSESAASGFAADGRPAAGDLSADDLPADAQPTPWAGVSAMINVLKAHRDEVLLDPGCGPDARLLIEAVKYGGITKAVGYEIDQEYADAARQRVEEAGLSGQIEIRTGDSLEADWSEFDVAMLYMWPEYNAQAAPKLQQLKRFVSYGFDVPGVATTPYGVSNRGTVYSWQRPAPVAAVAQVPITRTTRQVVRLPRGSYCEVCRGYCSNPMAHKLQTQIVGYRPAAAAPSGRWVTQKVCVNGVCRYVRTFVPN